MMKRLIVAIALVAATTTAWALENPPTRGDIGVMTKTFTACPKREDMEQILHLFDQNDGMAAGMATLEGHCIILDKGTIATIEQTKSLSESGICVRPRGSPRCVWTWGAMFTVTKPSTP
jgi:hypothetical protein